MENVVQLWLNPINLEIFFLCITLGIWILARSDPSRRNE
jgi:ABC-type thiamin/hydroxymethylpyrimidine transport system permease subunit